MPGKYEHSNTLPSAHQQALRLNRLFREEADPPFESVLACLSYEDQLALIPSLYDGTGKLLNLDNLYGRISQLNTYGQQAEVRMDQRGGIYLVYDDLKNNDIYLSPNILLTILPPNDGKNTRVIDPRAVNAAADFYLTYGIINDATAHEIKSYTESESFKRIFALALSDGKAHVQRGEVLLACGVGLSLFGLALTYFAEADIPAEQYMYTFTQLVFTLCGSFSAYLTYSLHKDEKALAKMIEENQNID